MPPVGFEPTISTGERPQNYALDRAATGIDDQKTITDIILRLFLTNGRIFRSLCFNLTPLEANIRVVLISIMAVTRSCDALMCQWRLC